MAAWRLWLGIGFGLGSNFAAVRDGHRLSFRSGDRVSAARAERIRSFLRDDPAAVARFGLAGSIGPGGSLRLRWAGRVDPRTRQRVRNVLVDLLH